MRTSNFLRIRTVREEGYGSASMDRHRSGDERDSTGKCHRCYATRNCSKCSAKLTVDRQRVERSHFSRILKSETRKRDFSLILFLGASLKSEILSYAAAPNAVVRMNSFSKCFFLTHIYDAASFLVVQNDETYNIINHLFYLSHQAVAIT